ncbi:RDD family protein [Microbacterium azadirachtae]|uniref:RDD family protein n=1 Tax=Microbacterium azadirachtae TaxID=582680 RepID=UPI000886A69F|nr:RDD family protein [Microbacterium azadirachtae]SDL56551.1 Uncharacterized membrane protein YckC, RDD family [Microbacterium azadirachtae]SEF85207.1 Uncharacterized membrane protein YckC, RDD family [Microbacterium azadirachtae]SEF86793.1 Uncharacterized membrane protein YckC, RDD family [Microbacterium azadirachtae]
MTNAPSGTGADAAPVAPIRRRAIACAIDLAIPAVILLAGYLISLGVTMSAKPDTLTGALFVLMLGIGTTFVIALVWFVISTFLQGAGASVGMRIMHLRVVREGREAPLGFGRALLRNLVFGLSASIVVGYFTPLFDGSGRFQGWHDRAAGAVVRDARAAAPTPAPATGGGQPAPAAPLGSPQPAPAGGALASGFGGSPIPSPTPGSAPAPTASFAPPAAFAPQGGAPTGHTLPNAPSAAGTVVPAEPEVDPHDATVLSAAAQAAADAAHAMITVVPGVSPSLPAPAAPVVSGPETVTPAGPPAPAAPPATVADALAQGPIAPAAEEEDLEETRISIPGHRLQFVWDDGARATVSGRTLFGRNPAPEPGATVVVVRDETLSLSKTHFEAAAEAAGGWVMDRHSTNGMTIVRDGVRIACPPGERVRIRLGDAIEIGDRIVTVGGYA